MTHAHTLAALAWWLLIAALAVFTLLHLGFDDRTLALAALHAVAGYAWVPAVPLLVAAVLLGERHHIGVAALLFMVNLSTTVPGTIPLLSPSPSGLSSILASRIQLPPAPDMPSIPKPKPPHTLRLVTANVLMVNPDPQPLIEELIALDADVIVIEELSHHWAEALEAHEGLAPWFYRELLPMHGSFGIAVLSRVPITVDTLDLLGVPMLKVDVGTGSDALRIYGVHTLPPRTDEYTEVWHRQMALLAETLGSEPGNVVLTGDLNATRHHPSYRRLLQAGLRDAHAEVGRASATTWPNGLFPVPPLRLDHVLVGGDLSVLHVTEGVGQHSDHRPVAVDLTWPAA